MPTGRRRLIPLRRLIALSILLLASPSGARAQIPSVFRNLQVLPPDISRDSLVQTMRAFSFATGLACGDCHVMGEDGAFVGARFHLDEKPEKEQARFMMRMVDRLNREVVPGLPGRDEPPLAVECKMCHRGMSKPFLLRTELRRVIDDEGIDAAIDHYRALREGAMTRGAYDFREWEMNELARELAAEGDDAAASAMLELNEEFHPTSSSIPRTLGPIYERLGRTGDAIAAYARALGRNPGDAQALERLRALTEGEGGGR